MYPSVVIQCYMYKLPSSDITTTVTLVASLCTLNPLMAYGLTNETIGVLLTSTLLTKIQDIYYSNMCNNNQTFYHESPSNGFIQIN